MSLFPITDGFNFDDLFKRVLERLLFFYCMVAIFFFVIDKASVAGYFETCVAFSPSYLPQMVLFLHP